ncbi:hypothetical protein C2845_PM09G08150 [Panicum miliaceum]|uniref:Uncharacterized protein n=1 Tax=Panicum miliaceum TaxID=4540 RepID=A0A3L6S4V8_PANMI|nr:hypothetical protein C2845_PM09G08150 [Panicum miliaceum]
MSFGTVWSFGTIWSFGKFWRSWRAIPVIGAVDGPLRRIRLCGRNSPQRLRPELVDLEKELCQTCTPLICYEGRSSPS